MPHKSLIIGWTLLILPPGDFGDLYRVSNPKTPWHPRKESDLCPLGQSQVYYRYTTGVFSSMGSSYGQTQGKHHWQPRLGSNQQRRSQSPACYHYTTGLYTRHINHSFDLPIDQYAKSCIIGFEPIT